MRRRAGRRLTREQDASKAKVILTPQANEIAWAFDASRDPVRVRTARAVDGYSNALAFAIPANVSRAGAA